MKINTALLNKRCRVENFWGEYKYGTIVDFSPGGLLDSPKYIVNFENGELESFGIHFILIISEDEYQEKIKKQKEEEKEEEIE